MTCLLRDLEKRECSCPAGTCRTDLGTFVKPERIVLQPSARTQFVLLAFAVIAFVGSIAMAIPVLERQELRQQEQVSR